MPQLSEMPIQTAPSPGPSSAPSANTGAQEPQSGAEEINLYDLPPGVANAPAIKLISVGAPPAVRVGPGEYYPEMTPVIENVDKLLESGLDIYTTQDKSVVLFNPMFISGQELQYLDQSGQLGQVVPDYGQVTGSQPQEIPDSEVSGMVDKGDEITQKLNAISGPQEQPPQATGTPTPVPPGSAADRGAVLNSQAQAIGALGGSPTSGPRPGGGRLLNALLKPPVQ